MAMTRRHHVLQEASRDRCFFCGQQFEADQLTREHVFPKWLQRKLDLWDHELTLLNGTSIRYRNLTIPACAPCNGVVLSRVEDEMSRSMPGGAPKVRELGHERLFVWLAKVFFGILYAEALLPSDRAKKDSERIVSPEVLRGLEHLHFLMQAARTRYEFQSPDTKYHTSILVFPLQQHPEPDHRFMYRDDIEFGCIALRLDTVGFIMVLDSGAQEKLADAALSALYSHNLHPLQFEEITALVFTTARSFTRSPGHIIGTGGGRVQIIQMPMGGLSTRPVFEGIDHALYARMLAEFTGQPLAAMNPLRAAFGPALGTTSAPSGSMCGTSPGLNAYGPVVKWHHPSSVERSDPKS
jgi:hypothetical protein